MKKNDVITLVIATVVIIASGIGVYIMLFGGNSKKNTEPTEADKIKSIPTQIDENTYEEINALSDYGKPELENIGKKDLFSGN